MTDPYAGLAVADPYEGLAVAETEAPKNRATAKYGNKTVTFDVPDGATDEDLRKLASNAFGKKGIKTPPVTTYNVRRNGELTTKAETQPLSTLGNIGAGARSVLEGAGGALDIFAAPINTGINALTGSRLSHSPFADAGAATADAMGLPKSGTDSEKFASSVVRGATAAAVPVAGAESLATRGVAGASEMAAQPLAQIVSGATGSGSGEIARQSGAPPAVQTLASLAGGVAPVAIGSTLKNVATGLAARATKAGAVEGAARTLQGAATDVPATIASISDAPKPTPDTLPTLAEVAKDPGLAAFQRTRTTTAVTERQASNAVTRGRAADETLGAGDPQAVQNLGTDSLKNAQQAVTDSRAAIGPDVDPTTSGANARATFDAAHNQARSATSRAYNAEPLTADPKPIALSNEFHNDVVEATKPFYGDGAAPMSPEFAQIVTDLRAPNPTSARFGNIDRRLADFAANIRRGGGSNTEAAAADSLRNVIESRAAELLPPDQVAALKAAKAARFDQGQRFENNPVAPAFDTKRYGEPSVPDAQIPARVVKPGPSGAATADAMTNAVGAQASEQVAREEMRRLVSAKELDTGEAVAALSTRYADALSRHPALKADMDALRDRAALLDAFRASPLGQLADASTDPAQAIAGMLMSKDGGRKLRALADQVRGNPDALNGLRRSLGGFLTHSMRNGAVTAEGVAIPDAKKAREAIDAVLQRGGQANILTAQQRIALERIRQEFAATTYAAKAGVAKAADGSPMAAAEAVGAVSSKASGAISTIKSVLRAIGNGKEVDALLEKAILEPSFAAELLAKPTPERLKMLRATISASVRGAASSTSDTGEPPDGRDPLP